MTNQALFSLKYKVKKIKCRLLQFSFGALRVKLYTPKINLIISMLGKKFILFVACTTTCTSYNNYYYYY